MAKFIIECDTKLDILRALFPTTFPISIKKELVSCKDCKYCITIDPFPHPYCEARMFGKTVDPEFFCADGEKK